MINKADLKLEAAQMSDAELEQRALQYLHFDRIPVSLRVTLYWISYFFHFCAVLSLLFLRQPGGWGIDSGMFLFLGFFGFFFNLVASWTLKHDILREYLTRKGVPIQEVKYFSGMFKRDGTS